MNTIEQLRYALVIQRERELASIPLHKPTSKRQAKSGHKYCRMQRAKQSLSMLDMGQERFHKQPVNDSRTKELLAGYYRRKGNKT
jgi:hypothetical protein